MRFTIHQIYAFIVIVIVAIFFIVDHFLKIKESFKEAVQVKTLWQVSFGNIAATQAEVAEYVFA